jgi:integrase
MAKAKTAGVEEKEEVKVRGVWEKVKGSGIWWIRFVDAEGKWRRERIGPKGRAKTLYTQRKGEAAAGKKIEKPLRSREKSFKEFADLALAYSKKNKANVADDANKIAILVAEFGSRQASALTQQDFTVFLEGRGNGPATFNRYRATLSMIYREAIRAGWTERNPARLIKSKKEPMGKVRRLADDEEARLRVVIEREYPEFLDEFEIALHTGMRKSEQFGMEWKKIDWAAQVVTVFNKNPRGGKISTRNVELNSVAIEVLKRHQDRTGHQTHVFLNSRGQPFPRSAQRDWFEKALVAAKVEDFTWHSMRHDFCSKIAELDVHLPELMALSGHKTPSMALRYIHLRPSHLINTVERLVRKKTVTEPSPESSPEESAKG